MHKMKCKIVYQAKVHRLKIKDDHKSIKKKEKTASDGQIFVQNLNLKSKDNKLGN